jgi:membrane protein YqaA with SNARE-associated domain
MLRPVVCKKDKQTALRKPEDGMSITGMRIDLRRAIPARAYPLMVGVIALVLTVSMTIPFASILIVAVLLRRDRWKEIVLVSSLGSATGGLILYLTFHYLGWSQIAAYYPDLPQSKAWADATRWVSAYGTWALLGFAAAPLPQTPALIFTAVSQLPVSEVFLALFLGKLLKYGVYGWLAAEFPSWFQRFAPTGDTEHRTSALGSRARDRAGASLRPSDGRVVLKGAERSQPIATVKTIDPSGDP